VTFSSLFATTFLLIGLRSNGCYHVSNSVEQITLLYICVSF